jgi:hypothetical protein
MRLAPFFLVSTAIAHGVQFLHQAPLPVGLLVRVTDLERESFGR